MSQEERIQELERLVAELQADKDSSHKEMKPWTEVSRYIENEVLKLPRTIDNPKIKWSIKESIITLIRHMLGLKRIHHLNNEQVDLAKGIADTLLNIYKTNMD